MQLFFMLVTYMQSFVIKTGRGRPTLFAWPRSSLSFVVVVVVSGLTPERGGRLSCGVSAIIRTTNRCRGISSIANREVGGRGD